MKLHLGKTSNQNGGFNVCLCILIIDPGRLRTWESKPTNFKIGKNPTDGSGWSYSNNEFLASMWLYFHFHDIIIYGSIFVWKTPRSQSPHFFQQTTFLPRICSTPNGPAGTAQSHLVRKPKNRSGENAGHLFGKGWTRGGWGKINDCDVWVILGDFVKFGNIPPKRYGMVLYSRRNCTKTWHGLLDFLWVFVWKMINFYWAPDYSSMLVPAIVA